MKALWVEEIRIINCTFSNHLSTVNRDSKLVSGIMITFLRHNLFLKNCTFKNNSAYAGGGNTFNNNNYYNYNYILISYKIYTI